MAPKNETTALGFLPVDIMANKRKRTAAEEDEAAMKKAKVAEGGQDEGDETLPDEETLEVEQQERLGCHGQNVRRAFDQDKIVAKLALHLPLKECFKLQRVSRHLHASKALRQRLFLEDAPQKCMTGSIVELQDDELPEGAVKQRQGERSLRLVVKNLPEKTEDRVRGKPLPTRNVHQANPLLFGGQSSAKKYVRDVAIVVHPPAVDGLNILPPEVEGPKWKVALTKKPNSRLKDTEASFQLDGESELIPEDFYQICFGTFTSEEFHRSPTTMTLRAHVKNNTSLARSLLCQPAVKDMQLHVRAVQEKKGGGTGTPMYNSQVHLHNPNGVTMGDVLEKTLKACDLPEHHDKGARPGQNVTYDVRLPRGVRLAMGGYVEVYQPLSAQEFDQL